MKLLEPPPDQQTDYNSPTWHSWFRFAWAAITQGIGLSSASQTLGSTTLASGTTIVNSKAIKASSLVFLSVSNPVNPGTLSTGARIVGTSFVINSSNASDASTVSWLIVEPL